MRKIFHLLTAGVIAVCLFFCPAAMAAGSVDELTELNLRAWAGEGACTTVIPASRQAWIVGRIRSRAIWPPRSRCDSIGC